MGMPRPPHFPPQLLRISEHPCRAAGSPIGSSLMRETAGYEARPPSHPARVVGWEREEKITLQEAKSAIKQDGILSDLNLE